MIADYALVGHQPDVTAAVQATLDTLAAAGTVIAEIHVPGVDELVDAQLVVASTRAGVPLGQSVPTGTCTKGQ